MSDAAQQLIDALNAHPDVRGLFVAQACRAQFQPSPELVQSLFAIPEVCNLSRIAGRAGFVAVMNEVCERLLAH